MVFKPADGRPSSRLPPYHCTSRLLAIALGALLVAVVSGCGSAPKRGFERAGESESAPPVVGSRARGGYYLDDGPSATPPADLDRIPEPIPRLEPLRAANMRPYVVMGQSFTPMTELQPYRARGVATWYGRRYHGRPTSSGEIYDMYGISAAHPTLPIPSYARVTNLANGKSVIVRINDRGPFIDNRLIDLSYTAAHRIGLLASGSTLVEVEAIIPGGSSPTTAVAAITPAAAEPPALARGRTTKADHGSASPAGLTVSAEADPIDALLTAAHERPQTTGASAVSGSAPSAAMSVRAAHGDGIYLQLGAFGAQENAESYFARALVQMPWLSAAMRVVAGDGLYRVQAGPYGNIGGAQAEAQRIAAALGFRPVLITRNCGELDARVRAAAEC